ncbi:MAG: 4-hydroxythreonine-4-phosphate dehydrogenase PdxA [Rhodospirillaceae bacterium]|nr:4-hydroxythreonine-4-phosphate dehydrogenase PdxA [Rhodospirillaceae bacterium]MYB13453.1 4-hydroxythreonine-4-phosphate dehydrogenase PdxA [Rhodospirillaceae bacterium]MYI48068.1 4-hydroxythreonine-4-phosphate dehydrogenase PdxA [Rhodospirillaceae bacterium]
MSGLPLALTMGEPAGIGGEIALKAWRASQEAPSGPAIPPFFAVDSPNRLRALSELPGCGAPVIPIDAADEAGAAFGDGLPVLPLGAAVSAEAGRPGANSATAVIESIDRAIDLVRLGRAGAMVTNPIQKAPLMATGFGFPGHTEYLEHRAGGGPVVMMLAGPRLRVSLVTVHLPLARVAAVLTVEKVETVGRITAEALRRDFGIARPRLAFAGFNPHAGEAGALGSEESEIVMPAVAALRKAGIDAAGPYPADTMFHDAARAAYDAAVCLYHDQGLIPLKTLDIERGVNVTLGLPWIRTSPDHGTALDIAGTGRASPSSLIAALQMAADLAQRRAVAGPAGG